MHTSTCMHTHAHTHEGACASGYLLRLAAGSWEDHQREEETQRPAAGTSASWACSAFEHHYSVSGTVPGATNTEKASVQTLPRLFPSKLRALSTLFFPTLCCLTRGRLKDKIVCI